MLLAMIALAALANVILHKWLYGEASLTGKRPPFLMARVIVDGPGLWYLRQNCTQVKLVICAYASKLHDGMSDDEFLWEPQGIWKSASPEIQDRLRAEEARFVLRAIRAYPKRQLYRSMANFREQMATFGLWDYGPNPYISDAIEAVLHGGSVHYLRSRQVRHELPDDFSTTAQMWAIASAIILIGLAMTTMTHFSRRLLGLVAVVISMVVANAFVTGVFVER